MSGLRLGPVYGGSQRTSTPMRMLSMCVKIEEDLSLVLMTHDMQHPRWPGSTYRSIQPD